MSDVIPSPVAPAAPVESEVKTGEATPADKIEERKFKLKFGKQEREVPESEALALAQKGWASDEKFKAAKQIERQVKDMLENGDPEALIKKKFGKDKLDWAKDILKDELRRRAMSPEEKEMEERKSRVDRLKKEEEDILSKRQKDQLDAATRHYEQQYDQEFSEAIKSEGLPVNKYAMSRCIKIASELVANGLEPDWKLVVREGKRQIQEELGTLLDQVSDGVGFIGEERARKISKALVAKGMAPKEAAKVVKQAVKEAQGGDSSPVDSDDWWARKRAAFGK